MNRSKCSNGLRAPLNLCVAVFGTLFMLACPRPTVASGAPGTAPPAGRYASQVAGAAGPMVVGTFPLSVTKTAIIDGDTVRVDGLDKSLRLLCIDTEEIYHHAGRKEAAARNFVAYARRMRGEGHPGKFGTPMGVEAQHFAERFFKGIREVRLEWDSLQRKNGFYGRNLVYIFAKKQGQWVNYNLEAVRQGMAPYFVKYGRSERFDDAFKAAQAEAQAKHLGIWGNKIPHYLDYPERLTWWEDRAQAIERFRTDAQGRRDWIEVAEDDGLVRAKAMAGKVVTLFGSFSDPRLDKKPYLMPLAHRRFEDVMLVAFSDEELKRVNFSAWKGKLVRVRGKLSLYKGKPQIKVRDLEKIWAG